MTWPAGKADVNGCFGFGGGDRACGPQFKKSRQAQAESNQSTDTEKVPTRDTVAESMGCHNFAFYFNG
jgi:hypothetical protein